MHALLSNRFSAWGMTERGSRESAVFYKHPQLRRDASRDELALCKRPPKEKGAPRRALMSESTNSAAAKHHSGAARRSRIPLKPLAGEDSAGVRILAHSPLSFLVPTVRVSCRSPYPLRSTTTTRPPRMQQNCLARALLKRRPAPPARANTRLHSAVPCLRAWRVRGLQIRHCPQAAL